jgi:hypothetical protein
MQGWTIVDQVLMYGAAACVVVLLTVGFVIASRGIGRERKHDGQPSGH